MGSTPYGSLFSNISSFPCSVPATAHPSIMEFPIVRREREAVEKMFGEDSGANGVIEDRIPHTQEKEIAGGANWVVQKFGGTSVGKFPTKIAEDIVLAGLNPPHNQRIAVVCSARSTGTKAEGTTNRLLRAARDVEAGSWNFANIVQTLRNDHLESLKVHFPTASVSSEQQQEISTRYEGDVNAVCDHLLKVLESALFLKDVTSQTMDMVMSVGEKLSCLYMTALLQTRGLSAVYVDLSEAIEPSSQLGLKGLNEQFYRDLATLFGEKVQEAVGDDEKCVPVITGYFGRVPPPGLLDQIGRGYTDLCAALVSVGLRARELQIWKEVDGIFSADPRKVPTARLLPSVSPSEAAELTFYGSEVIHPFTMHQVMVASIPIRIKNVLNPKSPGTVIVPEPVTRDSIKPKLTRGRSSADLTDLNKRRKPTAVTVKHSIVVLNVHSNKRTRASGFLARIFSILDKHHLSVDLISSSEVHVSMALHSEHSMVTMGANEELAIKDQRLQGAYDDLSELGSVDIVSDMAIVSLVGKDLGGLTGISGKFFSVLGDNNINIEMISQGASEINISCVISDRDADRALSTVHTHLFDFLE